MDDVILHPRFSPDRRGLISELVRRLTERRGLTASQLSDIVGNCLGRSGPAPEVIESWRTGQGGPPPGDVLTVLLELARDDEALAELVDALIGQRSDSQSDPRARHDRRPPWRVFISHTSELRDHPTPRSYVASAEAAILRAGHAVVDMAYFVARDTEPAAHCVSKLSATDLYVGIIGFRYGALVPGRSQSFTELEFETATALGMIPPFDLAQGAFVLWLGTRHFQPGAIHVAVVDPGVGTERRPIAFELGGSFYVGPDNGLFDQVIQESEQVPTEVVQLRRLPGISATFEGRDVFAPAAAALASGRPLAELGEPVTGALVNLPAQGPAVAWVDRFGNLITNLKPPLTPLQVNGHEVRQVARTFGNVPPDQPFVYLGSMGLIAIGVAKGRADLALGAGSGTPLKRLS